MKNQQQRTQAEPARSDADLARMIVEHFRQADAQFISADNPLGHVLRLGEAGLSMGQILSLPMVIVGGLFILYARRWKG